MSSLHISCINGNVASLRILINDNDINIRDEYQRTPLHYASNNHEDCRTIN